MVKGFYKSFTIAVKVNFDAEDLMDLILSRYHDMTYFMSMDIDWILDLMDKAIVKREEERLRDLYIVQFGKMTKENYISFEEYKQKVNKPQTNKVEIKETIEETYERFKAMVRKNP